MTTQGMAAMTTDNWLQLIAFMMAGGSALAGLVLRYSIKTAANTASINTRLEGFAEHVDDCEDDRKEIWKSIHGLELAKAAES